MKAIIMAGGMGTRLRPVTGEHPKPMADLAGRPIMEHIVRHLGACGFDDICAAVKYRAEEIMNYFGDGSKFGVRMQYRVESEPLGTAGAVRNCADFYGKENFLVISADAACDFDLKLLMEEHKKQEAVATIALYRDSLPLRYGLAVSDGSGRIVSFIEKPDWTRVVTDCVNTGIYIISPRAMHHVPEGREYDFGKELFPELLRRGEKIAGLEMQGYWCDIGTPLAYYKCCADAIEGRLKVEVPEGFRLKAEVSGEWDAEEESIKVGDTTVQIYCADRAGLMRQLSGEFMSLGAEYYDGIRLRGPRMEMHIRPSAEISALRLTVRSDDEEFARDMLAAAKDAVEETERNLRG